MLSTCHINHLRIANAIITVVWLWTVPNQFMAYVSLFHSNTLEVSKQSAIATCLVLSSTGTTCYYVASVGRGDSLHLLIHSPFRGEICWKSKKQYYHQKGQVFISKWPRFQPHTRKRIIFPQISKKKVNFFTPPEIWLEPKSCLCSIYHNFLKNCYFNLKFAVFLAITFHYDVLIGLFDTMIRVVVVGARSHPSNFRNWGWLTLFYYFS